MHEMCQLPPNMQVVLVLTLWARFSSSSCHFPGEYFASFLVTLEVLGMLVFRKLASLTTPPPVEIQAPHFWTASIWHQRSRHNGHSFFCSWTRALEDA